MYPGIPACLPDAVRDDLAHVSLMALPPSLHYRIYHWEKLDDAEREVTAGDVRLMAALLEGTRR